MARTKDGQIRHRIAFEPDVHQALHELALSRAASLQELADEAFSLLLKKYNRPVTVKEMLVQSARMTPANDRPPKAARTKAR